MGREDSSAGIATAYAVVATDESEIRMMQDEPSGPSTRPSIRVAPIGFLDKPGAPDCSATTTTWEDDFFDGDDYVVAVFDLDYDRMVCYYSQLSWTAYIASLFIPNCLVLGLCCGVPCYINKNVHWAVRSQHVALTRDGVRFVQEQRQTLWGFPCTDSGTSITMIPFDQIADCKIVEAAGRTCGCIENTLDMVLIRTSASSSKNHSSDAKSNALNIMGLRNAQGFVRLVLAMKQNLPPMPSAASILDRGFVSNIETALSASSAPPSEDVTSILHDIRDELRHHNTILQTLKVPTTES